MKLKAPQPLDPKTRREERQMQFMAGLIQNQEQLDQLLAGAAPTARAAMIEKLRPHLSFSLPETPEVSL